MAAGAGAGTARGSGSVRGEMRARDRGPRRLARGLLAGGGLLAAAVAARVAVVLAIPPGDPPADVVHVAAGMPPAAAGAPSAPPVPVGQPVTVLAGAAQVHLRHYRVDGVEALVATSDQPFPTPPGARPVSTGEMPWTATRGRVALYWPNSLVVIAAAVPPSQLPGLAAVLGAH